MKIKLVAVGKLKNPSYRDLAAEYLQRIQHFHSFEIVEIPDAQYKNSEPHAKTLTLESERIQKSIKPGSSRIALDEKGKLWTSLQLSEQLQNWLQSSSKEIVFMIGGAYGLEPELKQKAESTWSLSSLTLPHELARVVALEQIYRAFTILKNIGYHH